MASLKQIHSSLSFVATRAPDGTFRCARSTESVANRPEGCVGEGDALITDEPGLPVSIRTADCFPILLADQRNRVVAAIHAGWRGTDARIVESTLRDMRRSFGTDSSHVIAAIGPGIGVCCYEVGLDVGRRFGLSGAGRVDLAAANVSQLMQAGVPSAQIDVIPECTQCQPSRFHSFRRDKDQAGRMISYIAITPP